MVDGRVYKDCQWRSIVQREMIILHEIFQAQVVQLLIGQSSDGVGVNMVCRCRSLAVLMAPCSKGICGCAYPSLA